MPMARDRDRIATALAATEAQRKSREALCWPAQARRFNYCGPLTPPKLTFGPQYLLIATVVGDQLSDLLSSIPTPPLIARWSKKFCVCVSCLTQRAFAS
jgi:hypothetical protein